VCRLVSCWAQHVNQMKHTKQTLLAFLNPGVCLFYNASSCPLGTLHAVIGGSQRVPG
jgi:hypothetical protein